MKILVTGGAGFIGSTLVDALVARGDTVTVVDDLSRGRIALVPTVAKFVKIDVTEAQFADLVTSTAPDVIFHLAAQIDVRESVRDPRADAHANVMGTVNLLQAARESHVKRVIFASSGGTVYGDTDVIPTPEEHPLRPASPYGAAKASCEMYGSAFQAISDLEFVSLRFANVYGPRQDPHGEAGVVAIFSRAAASLEQMTINGDGEQTRDYVHVDDVVAALMAAMSGPSGSYNVGTGYETSVRQIAHHIMEALASEAAPLHAAARAGEQLRSCLAIAKAKIGLDWEPQVTLADGLASTARWFQEQAANVH